MRLDKYLKVARILKRRTISKELAENSRVLVNGKVAKPAKEVNIGDVIEIVYGNRVLKVKVKDIKDVVKKNDATVLYEVLDEYYIQQD
ncbi:MAG: RNA-binding S4 domain-containing protein [Erysipelotrichaceae bacterium]|nr:RNA-binding S4 domain-containing protein [Erysipelotrichaceae bacterium]MDY3830209.1 RNA-binding S4 domain-containing protein [Erysipelotrichaceae bacterium]MDY5727762.1 RNA-binding S4 domain-containing protein [Erysipelotrichaceae bacterium]